MSPTSHHLFLQLCRTVNTGVMCIMCMYRRRTDTQCSLRLSVAHHSSFTFISAAALTVLSTIHLISIMLPALVIFCSCSCWMGGGGGGKVTSGVR